MALKTNLLHYKENTGMNVYWKKCELSKEYRNEGIHVLWNKNLFNHKANIEMKTNS